MTAAGRLGTSFAASALVHAVVLVFLLRTMVAAPGREPAVVFPIALVAGGGGAPRGAVPGGEPAPPVEAPAPPPVASPAPRPAAPRPRAVVTRRPASPRPEPSPPAEDHSALASAPATAAPGGSGGEGGGAGGGRGGGTGDGTGDGGGSARVAYGTNPPPPYPLVARRLGKEGLVLLEVVVAPDGRAAAVRVLQSSGFPPLDEAAVTTVRERWRFLPAREGGTPVESRVTVPIRFRLEDARS